MEAGENNEALKKALNFTDEKREVALICLVEYQWRLSKQRQSTVNLREFQVGDLILKKNMGSMMDPKHGKLMANWEGPYSMTRATSTGAYYLQDSDGRKIPNLWNMYNLKKYYH